MFARASLRLFREVRRPVMAVARSASTAAAAPKMFCFQCEQTDKGTGCTSVGVCGKTDEVAGLQDLLMEQLKNIAAYASPAAEMGARNREMDKFVAESIFATLTNVNFDPTRFHEYLHIAHDYERVAHRMYEDACRAKGVKPTVEVAPVYSPSMLPDAMQAKSAQYGVLARRSLMGEDRAGVVEMCTYGLKGMCAYMEHASQLGHEDPKLWKAMQDTLNALRNPDPQIGDLLGLALKIGADNFEVLKMLDGAHTSHFGDPSPTQVLMTPKKGKCILISGHDLGDLEALLKQTEGTGINVYTHGEMLPAHGYPGLRKYKHLAGNFGGPWQLQKFDFGVFPGPILLTSNCLIEPTRQYRHRIFTTNVVGWKDVPHIKNRDFSSLIKSAQESEGFEEDEAPAKFVPVGFGHAAVLGMADAIVGLVKDKKISRFFFIGGCDGSEGERNYFTKLAKKTPMDSVILTAGCGKFRFNKLGLGELVPGVPRVLDMGQCNDSFGVVKVALGLADAFKTDVNSLPVSLAVSWFEQKAVAVLLTLLHLGIRNIRLGPRLPAFVTPAVLNVLVDKFSIKPIGDPEKDLSNMMAGK